MRAFIEVLFVYFLFQEKVNAAIAHLVERHLAKVEVASSSLVGRSNVIYKGRKSVSPFPSNGIMISFETEGRATSGAIAKW